MDNHEYYISRIKEALRNKPRGMTVSEISMLLNMSRNTIGKYLELMYLSGIVDQRNIGRSKLFFLSHKVPITRLLGYISDAIIQTDERFRIQMANLAANSFFEGGEEGILGRNMLDLLSMQGMKSEMRNRINDKDCPEVATYELDIFKGEITAIIWMTVANLIMHDGEKGWIFILEDVTEWKKAEENRRYYEQLYRFLLENCEERVFLMTPDEKIIMANEHYAQAFSKRPEELMGMNRRVFYDRRSGELLRDAAVIATETSTPHRAFIKVEQQGQSRWYDDRYYPVEDCSGNITGVFTVSRDITGFQEGGSASALVSALLPMLTEAVITTNPAGTVLSWNRGAEMMTGYPADELIGSSVYSVIPPDINNEFDVIKETLSELGLSERKGLIRAKGGRKRKIYLSGTSIYDKSGQLTGICLVCREQ